MNLVLATKSLLLGLAVGVVPAVHAQNCSIVLPEISDVMELAFPTWNVDKKNNRIEGGGKWNPYYLTKRWNGLDPTLGGYPTPIDTRYPFEFAAAFKGQPGGGSPHHCPEDYDPNSPIQACPKLITDNDDGEYGIGHVPPPIALAVVRNALSECTNEADLETWFDFESETAPCDILPSVLSTLIREKYARDPETGAVDYPPPVFEGTYEYFELEFPSPQGPPHWCTDEFWAAGQWADFCPYVFEGPNAGMYRHPHLALSAVMQYIANVINPSVCGVEWDDRGQYPLVVDSSITWAEMESDEGDAQPTLPYSWPENGDTKVKDVVGLFLMDSGEDLTDDITPEPMSDGPTESPQSGDSMTAAPTPSPQTVDATESPQSGDSMSGAPTPSPQTVDATESPQSGDSMSGAPTSSPQTGDATESPTASGTLSVRLSNTIIAVASVVMGCTLF